MTAYKLVNLLLFYCNLFGELFECDVMIIKIVSDLCESVKMLFVDVVV